MEARLLLSADVLTYHNDVARTGLDPNETTLTPANVNVSSFGKLGVDATDGKLDAEPLYVAGVTIPGVGTRDVLYVATEHDSLYAFDADTGALYWKASMLGPGEVPSDPIIGTQITPEIGITSTPTIDPTAGTLYLVAMSKRVEGGATTYFQRIHAIDIATGADKVAPVSIDGSFTYPGKGPGTDGTLVHFDPRRYKERDALLLDNGVVYTGWASHDDYPPYTGWVIAFHADDLSTASIVNVDPNGTPTTPFLGDGSGSSFWNSGDGPAADAAGNLYNLSANGPFDPSNGDYGDAFVKLSTAGGLAVADYFAPSDQQALAATDEDLGSSGITLVDVPDNAGVVHHLAIGSGKDGNIYVVDRDNLGHFSATGDDIYQEIPNGVGAGLFAAPATFDGNVYFGGEGTDLLAYRFVDGKLTATPTSRTADTFSYPGTSPSISSDGNADGIVWAYSNTDPVGLRAYDANNLAIKLYDSTAAPGGRDDVGAGNKFITPMIANGRVYVATTDGVGVFGLLPVATPPPVVIPPARGHPAASRGPAARDHPAARGRPAARRGPATRCRRSVRGARQLLEQHDPGPSRRHQRCRPGVWAPRERSGVRLECRQCRRDGRSRQQTLARRAARQLRPACRRGPTATPRGASRSPTAPMPSTCSRATLMARRASTGSTSTGSWRSRAGRRGRIAGSTAPSPWPSRTAG